MRYLQWSLLASTLWHVAEAAVRSKRWIVTEDGHVAEEPRLLRSEETHGRIRPGTLHERQAFIQEDEVDAVDENGDDAANTVSSISQSAEPLDCEWSNWTNWSSCSASCGGGTQKRARAVKRKEDEGGAKCKGNATEERNCNTQVCSRDCTWGAWTTWSGCSQTCGSGSSKRSREVKLPKQGEGKCDGNDTDVRTCEEDPCPKDCKLSAWSNWTTCEPFCKGTQKRNRSKIWDSEFGGSCGELEQSRDCENFCVDCKWSDWSDPECSKTCGGGEKNRQRNQTFKERGSPQLPGYDELGNGRCKDHYEDLQGEAAESNASCAAACTADSKCRSFAISKDADAKDSRCYFYNETASDCELQGDGFKSFKKDISWKKVYGYLLKRNRQCTTKPRQSIQSLEDAQTACDKDSACLGLFDSGCNGSVIPCIEMTAEVGTGCIYEKREIGGGEVCKGNASEVKPCNTELCSVDCEYTEWTEWAACSPVCTGPQVRTRNITKKDVNGGVPCGKTKEEKPCGNPCVDCSWSDWSTWQSCSKSCGGGLTKRTRQISQEAEGDGEKCVGNRSETQDCEVGNCPVDCVLNDWGAWGTCEPFCQGRQSRNRTVKRPVAFGGAACGELSEKRKCANFCMDCQLTDWSTWGTCSRSCSGGSRQRLRSEVFVQREASLLELGEQSKALGYEKKMAKRCDAAHQRKPAGAGATPDVAEAACSADPKCAGLYDEGCNGWLTMCEEGFSLEPEVNSCTYVKKEIGQGIPCTGQNVNQTEDCNPELCPVDCALSDWSPWATCVPFCQGTTKRNRTVVQEPQNGGVVCGKLSQVKDCSNECVDCEWSNFSAWSDCSASCGGGKQRRNRDIQVKVLGGGTNCSGNATEERPCNTQTCTVDCEWDEWSAWTQCSASCGGGTKKRSRAEKVSKANGGKDCQGSATDERVCHNHQCPKDCAVTDWTSWSECKPYCLGQQTRSRNVTVQSNFGGQPCPELEDSRVCSHYCVDCKWSDWTEFTNCSKSCEGGKKSREREQNFQLRGTASALVPGYTLLGPGQCKDFYETSKDADSPEACAKTCSADAKCRFFSLNLGVACNKHNESVGECDLRPQGQNSHKSYRKEQWKQTLGYEMKRHLKCTKARGEKLSLKEAKLVCSADPNCGGLYDAGCLGSAVICDTGFVNETEVGSCVYTKKEIGGGETCSGGARQVEDCNVQLCPINCEMDDWSAWGDCAPSCNGTETRSRRVTKEAKHGGKPCGEIVEQKPCSKICVDCRWSDWSAWDTCSASCDGGLQSRSRYEAVQAEGVGQKCEGNSSEMQACNTDFCPFDCETSDWSQWTDCEPYCNGTQNRSRTIQKPAAYGGAGCGPLSEMRSCANFCMDCQLSSWNDWSSCSQTCAGGKRQRTRSEVFAQRNKVATNEASEVESASSASLFSFSLLETGAGSTVFGYEKKLGVRCDLEHQQTLDGAGQTPDEAESSCSADHNCGGLYDKGCNGWLTICTVGLMLEPEADSCAYVKKEIGDGQPCTGDILESEDCSSELCPVDCKHSDWTEWTACNPFCAGVMNRSRRILEHPANGGAACGTIAEVQNCSSECVDCQWGSWGSWSSCSVSCGGSEQQRSRSQLVAQAGRGLPCQGNETSSKPCGEMTCPVDCKMEDWSDWTECTPYCSGTQMRSRGVVVEPLAGGAACGEASNVVNCSNACVDCEVSTWSVWSLCSASCGSGRQTRSRLVLVEAEGDAAACPEDLEAQKEGCNPDDCPVDCQWADWSPWNGCSVTCGGGNRTRTRGKMSEEQFGGSPCEGDESKVGSCSEIACPQDCIWSEWGAWGNCSTSCGGGNQSRFRYVTQIALGEGTNCSGGAQDLRNCNEEACRKDCEFMDWEEWSECSVSCGIGNHSRIRQVNAEVNGGSPCDPAVPTRQSEECSQPCPRDCAWGDWGAWTNCSKSCGEGPSAGTSTRHRVEAITAAFGGLECHGATVEHERCNDKPCPIDCEWKDWTLWTECVQPCGSEGTRQRSRNSTEARNGGEECVGEATEVSHCTVLGGCSVNCTWEDWNEWTACSASCGDGNRVRFRFVADEAVGPHGLRCLGDPEEEMNCETGVECPVDCEYNDWKDWGPCEVMPCGPSKKLRARTKQPARYGGKACDGNASQEEECFIPDSIIIECDENGKPVTTTTTTTSTSTVTTTTTFTTTTVTTTVTTTTTSFADVALTTVGLSADSAAAAASAAASVTVEGVEILEVSPSAEGFSTDSAAVESVKESIALEAGVSTDAVIIKSISVEETPSASLLSLGSRPRRKRRETPSGSGSVKVEFEIVPQLNNKKADDVLDAMDKLGSEEAADKLEHSLVRHSAPYTVKVASMNTKEVSKDDRHTVRESQIHSGTSPMFSLALRFLPLVFLWFGS